MLISPGKPAEEHPVLFLQLVPDLSSEDVFRPMLKVLHIQQKQLNRAGSESHCWCFIEAAAAQKTHYLLFDRIPRHHVRKSKCWIIKPQVFSGLRIVVLCFTAASLT